MHLKELESRFQVQILLSFCILLSVSFIFPYNVASSLIIFSFIYYFVLYRFKNVQIGSPAFILTLFLFCFLTINVINLFRSENFNSALLLVQTRLSLAFIPLLIFISPFQIFKPKHYDYLIGILTAATIIYTTSVILAAFHEISHRVQDLEFGNITFSEFIRTSRFHQIFRHRIGSFGVHQVYLSTFISWCGINLVELFYKYKVKSLKIMVIVSFLILTFYSALLASRLPLFILLFSSLIIILVRSTKIEKIIISCLTPILILLLFQIPSLSNRTKTLITDYRALSNQKTEKRSDRRDILYCSLECLKGNIIYGTGLRNYESDLVECYKEIRSMLAYNRKYNTHNQYFDIIISMGIFGLVSLLLILTYSIWCGIRNRNLLHIILISMFIINMATENMFNRFHGILLFSLFNAIFIKMEENKKH